MSGQSTRAGVDGKCRNINRIHAILLDEWFHMIYFPGNQVESMSLNGVDITWIAGVQWMQISHCSQPY